MMYPVIQWIESSDGGDQVRLTELSLSAVTDNPIGGPTDVIFLTAKDIFSYFLPPSKQYRIISFRLKVTSVTAAVDNSVLLVFLTKVKVNAVSIVAAAPISVL
jgi:hypothetical protein